jgi:Flp pilus assembly pilin Flp
MSGAAWSLAALLRRFARGERAAAAVEFALVLPIMLLVYVGTVEASALITMDRKVQSVSGALGDLVARSNETISTATLTDYFRAASGVMVPYSADPLRQVVTQVSVDDDGTARVDWSRQFVDGEMAVGDDYAEDSSFDLPEEMIDIAEGQFVIVSEVSYSYLPLYGIVFDQPVQLRRESFYMPRFGGGITIN